MLSAPGTSMNCRSTNFTSLLLISAKTCLGVLFLGTRPLGVLSNGIGERAVP